MKSNTTSKYDEDKTAARLLAEIREHVRTHRIFGDDTGGIIHLFFVERLNPVEISKIHELPLNNVSEVICGFLKELITERKSVQRVLCHLAAKNKLAAELCTCAHQGDKLAIGEKVKSLIATCDTPDSLGDRIREIVGTAIKISAQLVPSTFCDDMFSKVRAATIYKTHSADFFIDLKERNFFLGHLEEAAGEATVLEIDQVAKTCSDGTVVIERGREKVTVDFHIALLEKTPPEEIPEYEITFHNLPTWATPVFFSFVGPNDVGVTKEYQLPLKFCKGRFYFEVENKEQKDAFLDKTEKPVLRFLFTENSKSNHPLSPEG